jgi:hypothetical protein
MARIDRCNAIVVFSLSAFIFIQSIREILSNFPNNVASRVGSRAFFLSRNASLCR